MPDIVATRQQLAAQQQKPVKTETDAPQQPNGEEAPQQQPAAATVDAMEVSGGGGGGGSWRLVFIGQCRKTEYLNINSCLSNPTLTGEHRPTS